MLCIATPCPDIQEENALNFRAFYSLKDGAPACLLMASSSACMVLEAFLLSRYLPVVLSHDHLESPSQ